MYRVEVFSDEHNDYITHSWHKNREYAEIQAEVKAMTKDSVRIIHEGKAILWYRNGKKVVGGRKGKMKG